MLYSLLRPTQGGEKNGQVLSDLRKRPHERQQRQPFRAPHPSPVGSEHAARARCCGRLRLPYERLHSLPAQRQSSARSVKSLNIAEDSTHSQRECVVFLWGRRFFCERTFSFRRKKRFSRALSKRKPLRRAKGAPGQSGFPGLLKREKRWYTMKKDEGGNGNDVSFPDAGRSDRNRSF